MHGALNLSFDSEPKLTAGCPSIVLSGKRASLCDAKFYSSFVGLSSRGSDIYLGNY